MNNGGQLAGTIKWAAQQLQTVDKLVEPMGPGKITGPARCYRKTAPPGGAPPGYFQN